MNSEEPGSFEYHEHLMTDEECAQHERGQQAFDPPGHPPGIEAEL